MGFFSKIRRKVSKFIPKEVKPFLPYIAAAIPGGPFAAQGIMGAYSGAGNAFLKASLARGASDEDASLKDALRTGAFAAAPQAIGTGLGQFANSGIGNVASPMQGGEGATGMQRFLQGTKKYAGDLSQSGKLNPEFKYGNLSDTAKVIGAQGSIDMGIKAAELNEDALADYNRQMLESGVNDKAGRRAAIRQIYANTGTWDMGEVDAMLDTYGYRTGGRVGYEEGGSVITLMDGTTVQIPEDSYTSSGGLKDIIYSSSRGDLLREEIIRELSFAKGGRVNYEEGGSVKYKHFQDMLETAKEGLASLEDDGEVMPIRELRLKEGGSVDDKLMERVKELQDEGLDFASAMAQAMKEDMASGKAMGGIMDVNMEETIDTPKGDMTMDENIKVADSTLMDAYKIYRFDMMEQGLEPMSLEEFKDQAMSEGKMANMDYREFIYDASRDNFANDMFGKDYGDLNEEETEEVDIIIEMELGKNQAAPERTMAASGGLMNLGGKEMDLRGGGFVPMGRAERADDVPARLSKNEFVMTADAVRAAGGGSVKKGADLMYDQMKQLERQA